MVADALAPCVARTSATMKVSPGLIGGRISVIFGMSVWRNDTKCKYMFMFPLKNLACKEFIFSLTYQHWQVVLPVVEQHFVVVWHQELVVPCPLQHRPRAWPQVLLALTVQPCPAWASYSSHKRALWNRTTSYWSTCSIARPIAAQPDCIQSLSCMQLAAD